MSDRPFRFGVNLGICESRAKWQDKARHAESLGYDVLAVPDHLGLPAPFPALATAAEVTTARLGTYVLNICFYRPALLAREVATTDLLADGRLELGLGAGYVKEEFEAAGLPFVSGGERLNQLRDTVTEMRGLFADGHRPPAVQQPMPPIMVAGSGPRMLRYAAEHAEIVGIAFSFPQDENDTGHTRLAEQAELVRTTATALATDPELNLLVLGVYPDVSTADLSFPRQLAPDLSEEQIRTLPGLLGGSPATIADTLREYRERYGLTYFTVPEFHMEAFAEVIARLR
ncbi:TIGR03621 family F420-dependent LLM class oxidoreductase [Sciscionella sediminilitoris]|uniref:TIGR03621 family F420-dependent LLM class oxidoreductase n=1 Tax=Sciscionella sediminilitoris TaxID=1445613 RepID=UPI0004DEEE56|nr:TIGR03621 family F420-dependent LLM class oxidoreductase [Sciscionella sp. SE31]